MSDPLIVEAAAAQVEVIYVSLTRSTAGGSPSGAPPVTVAEPPGPSWLPVWAEACGALDRMGRGTARQCAELVWRQIDLATDLSGQSWWGNPRLQQAAVGEIAWTTVTGRWGGSVPSASAQQAWERSQAITDTIRRRHLPSPLFGRRHATPDRLAEARRMWEDAWWSWATAHELAGGVLSRT